MDNTFIQLGFKEYTKLFDLSQLNLQKSSDSLFMNNIKMKNMRQINVDLVALKKEPDSLYKRDKKQMGVYVKYSNYKDSVPSEKEFLSAQKNIPVKKLASFDTLIPDSLKDIVYSQTLNDVGNARSVLEMAANDFKNQRDDYIQHQIECALGIDVLQSFHVFSTLHHVVASLSEFLVEFRYEALVAV